METPSHRNGTKIDELISIHGGPSITRCKDEPLLLTNRSTGCTRWFAYRMPKSKRGGRHRTMRGIIWPWINIPSMAQRRRFGDSLLFRQFAKSAYYFTPLPGTGCVPPLLERDGCDGARIAKLCPQLGAREKQSHWGSGKGKGSLE